MSCQNICMKTSLRILDYRFWIFDFTRLSLASRIEARSHFGRAIQNPKSKIESFVAPPGSAGGPRAWERRHPCRLACEGALCLSSRPIDSQAGKDAGAPRPYSYLKATIGS